MMQVRGARFNQITAILVITTLAAFAGLASELGRVLLKGSNYAYLTLHDWHYYAAMSIRLWETPLAFSQEVAALKQDSSASGFFTGLVNNDFGPTGYYWSVENGLSHQLPYAYRALAPSITGLLNSLGLSITIANLIIYLVGIILLANFAYLLIGRDFTISRKPAIVASGACIAALATLSPGYPDMLYLGLATAAVWAASKQKIWLFIVFALLATLARETGIFLVLVWIAYLWAARSVTLTRILPALVPLLALMGIRLLVKVPNSSIDLEGMLDFVSWRFSPYIIFGVYSIITIGLISPRIMRIAALRAEGRVAAVETFLWFVGVFVAFGGMLLATNTSRLALLSLPLFLAGSGWIGAKSQWWLGATLASALGYTIADTLANRSDAFFGQEPWKYAAILVISLQLVALLSDRRRTFKRPLSDAPPNTG